MEKRVLTIPLKEQEVRELSAGDTDYLTGHIFTSRDMGHLKLKELAEKGEPLPKDFHGAVIFHAGPVCLKRPDSTWYLNVIGPTTSIRMEPYADMVGKLGVRAIIGKGGMEQGTLIAGEKYGYVYLQAAPGCAADLARFVRRVCSVDWFEMGMPEALWDLEVEEFGPLVVGMDTRQNSIYTKVKTAAQKKLDEIYPGP